MDKNDILELFEYNVWAEGRLIASLEEMKPEDFSRDMGSSHGGIRGTLLHMVNAENIWTNRLAGEPIVPLQDSEVKSLADFKSHWDSLNKRLSGLIGSWTDEYLHSPFGYQDSKGNKYTQPRIWGLSQLFNHFTYHRGQIVAMQRQLGYKPVNTDLIGYYRQKGK